MTQEVWLTPKAFAIIQAIPQSYLVFGGVNLEPVKTFKK